MTSQADAAALSAEPHLGEAALFAQLAACGLAEPVAIEQLVFNPNNPVTGSVDRIALADGTNVVRKVVCRDRPVTVPHWPSGRTPGEWNYWRREVDAYDSGATAAFADAGARAPVPVGRVSPADGVEVLFLEHVEGRSGAEITVGDLADLAGRLGEVQGTLGPPPQDAPWASRGWMWAYASSRLLGPSPYDDPTAWEHPVVVAGWGDERHQVRARWGEVMRELPRWQAVAATLPPTTAHLDCWSNNVIVEAAGPVLLDWSFVGEGPVGIDVGNLVPDGLLDHLMPPDAYGTLDAAVWHGYAAGLERAGWPHPLELARLGMCLGVLKFAWLPGLMVRNAGFTGPTAYGGQDGMDLVEVFRRRAAVLDAMLDRVDEASSFAVSVQPD